MFGELPGGQARSVGEGAPGLVKRFLLGAVRSLKSGEQLRQGREASALAFHPWTLWGPQGLTPSPSPAHPPFSGPPGAAQLWGRV